MLKFKKQLNLKNILINKRNCNAKTNSELIMGWLDRKNEYLKELYRQQVRVNKLLDERRSRTI